MSQRSKSDFNENSEIEILGSSQKDANFTPEKCKTMQKNESCRNICHIPGLGIICALLCAWSYSTMSFLVKFVDDVHPLQMSVSRCFVQFLIILPLLQYKSKEVDILGPEGLRQYMCIRAVAGSGAMVFLYQSVGAMSVGNAVTLNYTSTIMVPIMARIFLKEALTVFDLIFAVVSVTGVVLITQPTFLFPVSDEQQPTNGIGVLYALSGAVCQSISIVSLRKLGRGIYPALNVLYHSVCGAVVGSILLTVIGEWSVPCLHDLPYVFSLGILGVTGQYGLIFALHIERAGTVGVLILTQIIIIYLYQVLALGDIPNMLSLIGAALVFSSGVGVGIRKIVNETKRKRSIAKSKSFSSKGN